MKRDALVMNPPMLSERLNFVDVHHQPTSDSFSLAVATGLSLPQKTLPSRFFYDARGSVLFEKITELPEYYLTRTEADILCRSASQIVTSLLKGTVLVEFGSGSSCKTRFLIEALLEQQATLHYTPIDISRDFLRESALTLLADYPQLKVTALAAEYHAAIESLQQSGTPRLFLFLGSNLGNFDADEAVDFLQKLRGAMHFKDRLLLGVDLVKERAILEAAYDDAQKITAEFNKNILLRINRELDANFDLTKFAHSARFNAEHSRVEMHLVSQKAQSVHIKAIGKTFSFRENESVHTENSHKYTQRSIAVLCAQAELTIQESWTDSEQRFAVLLIRPDLGDRVHSAVRMTSHLVSDLS